MIPTPLALLLTSAISVALAGVPLQTGRLAVVHELSFGETLAGLASLTGVDEAQLRAAALPRGWRLGLCAALFGVMALDGTQALLYDTGLLRLYTPNLYLRLGTGLASGVGIAMVLVPLTNQALWQQSRTDRPLFTGWKDAAGMATVQALLFVLTLSNWAPALMTLVLVLLTRRAGHFTTWRATAGYFAAGLLLAVAFIGVLAGLRLALFGAGPLG